MPGDVAQSPGAVVIRARADATPEMLLVHRRHRGDWVLPGGTPDPGEPAPVAAVRGVLAQTGQAVRLGRPVGGASAGSGARQVGAYRWRAAPVGAPARRTDGEIDAVDWFPFAASIAALSGASDRAAVADAVRLPRTVALVVSRHTAARARPDWLASDPDRPLDERGAHDAVRLAGVLAAWSPRRVITSPSTRCVETVTPYAARTTGIVELEPLLSEEGFAHDPRGLATFLDALVALLRRSLDADDGGAVLCTHRPVLATMAAQLSVALKAAEIEEPLPPGGCWVAHVPVDGPPTVEQHVLPPASATPVGNRR